MSEINENLLNGIKSLTGADYPIMQKNCNRNDRLLRAALCAYVKFYPHTGSAVIDDEATLRILADAIRNEIGVDKFLQWCKKLEEEK